MEYVSLLAGEPFSDRPACTHPALAALARGINDRLTDTTRPALLIRAPVLAAIGPRTPGVAAVTATAALADLRTGHPGRDHGPGRGPGPWELCKVERRLARLVVHDRPGRSWWGRHRDQVLARQLIHVGLDRARRLPPGPARDHVMLRMLDQALLTISPAA